MRPEWVMRVTQALLDTWTIGEFSQFCDDPPDFDAASIEEIADLIWAEYQDAAGGTGDDGPAGNTDVAG